MTGSDMAVALCMLVVGIYMLVCALRCKGMVYENDNFDYESEYFQKYCRVVRAWCFALFFVLTTTFVFSMLAYFDYYSISLDSFEELTLVQKEAIIARYRLYSYIGFYSRYAALAGVVAMIINTFAMGKKAQKLAAKKTRNSVLEELKSICESDDTDKATEE